MSGTQLNRAGRLVGAGALLALSACVDAGGALTIIQNQVPLASMDNSCTIPSMRSTEQNQLGTFDVALDKSYPYYLYPLLHNGLPQLATGSVEPNLVEISTWEVRIEPPPTIQVAWTPACPPQFDYPSPATLLPTEESAATVEAMRPCHSALLHQLMATGKINSDMSERVIFRLIVRAKGRHGGTEIRSDPFEFPVRVCWGCLQTGFTEPAFADLGFPKVPACKDLATNPYRGNACNPAQDKGPVLCCARDDEGQVLECPGIPRAPPAP